MFCFKLCDGFLIEVVLIFFCDGIYKNLFLILMLYGGFEVWDVVEYDWWI